MLIIITVMLHVVILCSPLDLINGFSGEPVRMVAPVQESYYNHQEQLNERVRADDEGERGQETGKYLRVGVQVVKYTTTHFTVYQILFDAHVL